MPSGKNRSTSARPNRGPKTADDSKLQAIKNLGFTVTISIRGRKHPNVVVVDTCKRQDPSSQNGPEETYYRVYDEELDLVKSFKVNDVVVIIHDEYIRISRAERSAIIKSTKFFGGDEKGRKLMKSQNLEDKQVRIWHEIKCAWFEGIVTNVERLGQTEHTFTFFCSVICAGFTVPKFALCESCWELVTDESAEPDHVSGSAAENRRASRHRTQVDKPSALGIFEGNQSSHGASRRNHTSQPRAKAQELGDGRRGRQSMPGQARNPGNEGDQIASCARAARRRASAADAPTTRGRRGKSAAVGHSREADTVGTDDRASKDKPVAENPDQHEGSAAQESALSNEDGSNVRDSAPVQVSAGANAASDEPPASGTVPEKPVKKQAAKKPNARGKAGATRSKSAKVGPPSTRRAKEVQDPADQLEAQHIGKPAEQLTEKVGTKPAKEADKGVARKRGRPRASDKRRLAQTGGSDGAHPGAADDDNAGHDVPTRARKAQKRAHQRPTRTGRPAQIADANDGVDGTAGFSGAMAGVDADAPEAGENEAEAAMSIDAADPVTTVAPEDAQTAGDADLAMAKLQAPAAGEVGGKTRESGQDKIVANDTHVAEELRSTQVGSQGNHRSGSSKGHSEGTHGGDEDGGGNHVAGLPTPVGSDPALDETDAVVPHCSSFDTDQTLNVEDYALQGDAVGGHAVPSMVEDGDRTVVEGGDRAPPSTEGPDQKVKEAGVIQDYHTDMAVAALEQAARDKTPSPPGQPNVVPAPVAAPADVTITRASRPHVPQESALMFEPAAPDVPTEGKQAETGGKQVAAGTPVHQGMAEHLEPHQRDGSGGDIGAGSNTGSGNAANAALPAALCAAAPAATAAEQDERNTQQEKEPATEGPGFEEAQAALEAAPDVARGQEGETAINHSDMQGEGEVAESIEGLPRKRQKSKAKKLSGEIGFAIQSVFVSAAPAAPVPGSPGEASSEGGRVVARRVLPSEGGLASRALKRDRAAAQVAGVPATAAMVSSHTRRTGGLKQVTAAKAAAPVAEPHIAAPILLPQPVAHAAGRTQGVVPGPKLGSHFNAGHLVPPGAALGQNRFVRTGRGPDGMQAMAGHGRSRLQAEAQRSPSPTALLRPRDAFVVGPPNAQRNTLPPLAHGPPPPAISEQLTLPNDMGQFDDVQTPGESDVSARQGTLEGAANAAACAVDAAAGPIQVAAKSVVGSDTLQQAAIAPLGITDKAVHDVIEGQLDAPLRKELVHMSTGLVAGDVDSAAQAAASLPSEDVAAMQAVRASVAKDVQGQVVQAPGGVTAPAQLPSLPPLAQEPPPVPSTSAPASLRDPLIAGEWNVPMMPTSHGGAARAEAGSASASLLQPSVQDSSGGGAPPGVPNAPVALTSSHSNTIAKATGIIRNTIVSISSWVPILSTKPREQSSTRGSTAAPTADAAPAVQPAQPAQPADTGAVHATAEPMPMEVDRADDAPAGRATCAEEPEATPAGYGAIAPHSTADDMPPAGTAGHTQPGGKAEADTAAHRNGESVGDPISAAKAPEAVNGVVEDAAAKNSGDKGIQDVDHAARPLEEPGPEQTRQTIEACPPQSPAHEYGGDAPNSMGPLIADAGMSTSEDRTVSPTMIEDLPDDTGAVDAPLCAESTRSGIAPAVVVQAEGNWNAGLHTSQGACGAPPSPEQPHQTSLEHLRDQNRAEEASQEGGGASVQPKCGAADAGEVSGAPEDVPGTAQPEDAPIPMEAPASTAGTTGGAAEAVAASDSAMAQGGTSSAATGATTKAGGKAHSGIRNKRKATAPPPPVQQPAGVTGAADNTGRKGKKVKIKQANKRATAAARAAAAAEAAVPFTAAPGAGTSARFICSETGQACCGMERLTPLSDPVELIPPSMLGGTRIGRGKTPVGPALVWEVPIPNVQDPSVNLKMGSSLRAGQVVIYRPPSPASEKNREPVVREVFRGNNGAIIPPEDQGPPPTSNDFLTAEMVSYTMIAPHGMMLETMDTGGVRAEASLTDGHARMTHLIRDGENPDEEDEAS